MSDTPSDSLRSVFAGLRQGFNEGAGYERVLLYSSLVPLLVMKRYAMALEELVYQEFFLIGVLFLALAALAVKLWRRSLRGAVGQAPGLCLEEPVRLTPVPSKETGQVERFGEPWIWVTGALFAVWSGASAFWSPSPYWGWHWAGSWLGFLVYGGLLSLALRRESFLRVFLGVLLVGMGILCVAEIGRCYIDDFSIGSWGRLSWLQAAEILAMFVPLTGGLFLVHPHRLWRAFGLVCYVLFFWMMLQTAKRSPAIGLLAAVIVGGVGLAWLARRERCGVGHVGGTALVSRRFFRRLGLIVLLAGAMTWVQTRPTMFNGWGMNVENLADRLQPEVIMDASLQERFQSWAVCHEMFKANPLAGQGAGSFRTDYRHYRGVYFQNQLPWGYFLNDEARTPTRAHNQYLQVLGELGLVGLVLLGLFLATVLWTLLRRLAWRCPNAGEENWRRQFLALCSVLGLVVFCVSAAASPHGFHSVMSSWVFWVLLGLALAWSRPGARSEAQGPSLAADPSQVEADSLRQAGEVSPVAPLAAGWFGRSGPGAGWGVRMALLSGLGVTAAMGYASFRMVMSDFHYGMYFASGGRVPSRLEAALAWQPQNPGPHFLAAKAQLEHLLLIHRALLSIAPRPDTAGTGTPSKANSTVGSEENLALISRLLKKVQIQGTLDHLDLMSRNGVDVLVVHALKALTAEMVSNRSLALSFIEQARRNGYSDSPFLGAYYLHLSRLLGRDEVETRERLALVFRYQPEAFQAWQVYFDDPLAVADNQLERYSGLEGNLGFFHYFYRKIREK